MNKWIIISIVLVVVLAGGFGAYWFYLKPDVVTCPETCDDENACTLDSCGASTDYECQYADIRPCEGNSICEPPELGNSSDCPNCDDSDPCTDDLYNFKTQECRSFLIENCDGNGICEYGEYNRSLDCPDCDDDNHCTSDLFDYEKLSCVNSLILGCCGNLICETSESYLSCKADCRPTIPELITECGTDDSCITGLAVRYNTSQFCWNTVSQEGKESCISEMASFQGNLSLCILLPNSKKADCLQNAIIDKFEVQDCLYFLEYPNLCIESIAIRELNGSICLMIIEETGFKYTQQERIEKCMIIVRKDVLQCKTLTKEYIRDDCYRDLARILNNPSICDAHTNPDKCMESLG